MKCRKSQFEVLRLFAILLKHIAKSAFAIFIGHQIPQFFGVVKSIHARYDGVAEVLLQGVWIVVVFITIVLVDQLRLLIWRMAVSKVEGCK